MVVEVVVKEEEKEVAMEEETVEIEEMNVAGAEEQGAVVEEGGLVVRVVIVDHVGADLLPIVQCQEADPGLKVLQDEVVAVVVEDPDPAQDLNEMKRYYQPTAAISQPCWILNKRAKN